MVFAVGSVEIISKFSLNFFPFSFGWRKFAVELALGFINGELTYFVSGLLIMDIKLEEETDFLFQGGTPWKVKAIEDINFKGA